MDEQQVIGWGEETPGALIQCSMMSGMETPATQCKERARYGVVNRLRGEPFNYRLWAFCPKHMELWTKSQRHAKAGA